MSTESLHSHPIVISLQQRLISCSESAESGDFRRSDESLSELIVFLNSISDAIVSDAVDESYSEDDAFQILTEIHGYVASPSLDQEVIDRLAFELPKTVARFACVSPRCLEVAENVVNMFVETCSPRDMLSILCEALDSLSEMFKVPGYFAPLLSAVSKVFVSIQRHQFEQIKEAVPIILNVLEAICTAPVEGDADYEDLFDKSISIANSIQAVCKKLEGKVNEKLRALLGFFVLQIMALVSISIRDKVSSHLPLVVQLSLLLQYCDLSYLGLITGDGVNVITRILVEEVRDGYMGCFSYVNLGASLAVIWGHLFNEVAQAVNEDLAVVKTELSCNQTKRWQTLGMLRHIFSCVNLPWELKKHAINFLLWIVEGNVSYQCNNENMENSFHMTSLFSSLQAVKMVVMFAPDSELRKNAFNAMKKVLGDIPASLRFDILMALIKNSNSSSMIAILIDCLKEEMHQNISSGNEVARAQMNAFQGMALWNPGVLEVVELVLRPPHRGPPSLPKNGDAVLSALNLYRFTLITESTRNTNYTGVLSKNKLRKACDEWFLPLRLMVTSIMTENRGDYDQLALDTVCVLNPVELVLHRCIELVEEKLKYVT